MSVPAVPSTITLTPVLLAGGSGTRLWPLSRKSYPKQFVPLVGEETLFQASARRLSGAPAPRAGSTSSGRSFSPTPTSALSWPSNCRLWALTRAPC
jgi:hypothetical protein